MSVCRNLFSRFRSNMENDRQPFSGLEWSVAPGGAFVGGAIKAEQPYASPGQPRSDTDRTAVTLRKLINYINGSYGLEKRIIDLLIQESAAKCLKSSMPVCPECGIGWMQPVGAVTWKATNLDAPQDPEMRCEPTLRCNRYECQFESRSVDPARSADPFAAGSRTFAETAMPAGRGG